jgi:hypothetical protein
VFAAVAFVPCMVIGLLIGAKLAPAFFRALGLSSTSAGGP